MTPYAETTSVPVERSRAEIEKLLTRYGADQFATGWDSRRALIQFRASGRIVRFELPMPDPTEKRFTHSQRGRTFKTWHLRSNEGARAAYEQELRRCWRALALVIKAKLEAVETRITTFEAEFMAHIVLPDGSTVGQFMGPQIETAYSTGRMPSAFLLPAPEGS